MLRHDIFILIFPLGPHLRLSCNDVNGPLLMTIYPPAPYSLPTTLFVPAALFSGTQSQRYLKSHARIRPFF
jgi:hypothetical protein